MAFYRIHIRPRGGSVDMKKTFDYCLRNGILGAGWRINSNKNIKNWDNYLDEASLIHDNLSICKYIKDRIGKDDLVWTRNAGGQYYISRVLSGWEYFMTQEAIDYDIDIANIFRVEFKKVPIDEVPGKVIACFRAPKTIQGIDDEKAFEYSKYLWNALSGKNIYEVDKSKYSDIFMMLDDEETEDLVFLFLQSEGWYVVPNSRKGDTMSFEYFVVDPKSGEKALSQVKTGNNRLNRDNYIQYPYKIFLFQSNEYYDGNENVNIECLNRKELLDFLYKSITWLPKIFKRKMELIEII